MASGARTHKQGDKEDQAQPDRTLARNDQQPDNRPPAEPQAQKPPTPEELKRLDDLAKKLGLSRQNNPNIPPPNNANNPPPRDQARTSSPVRTGSRTRPTPRTAIGRPAMWPGPRTTRPGGTSPTTPPRRHPRPPHRIPAGSPRSGAPARPPRISRVIRSPAIPRRMPSDQSPGSGEAQSNKSGDAQVFRSECLSPGGGEPGRADSASTERRAEEAGEAGCRQSSGSGPGRTGRQTRCRGESRHEPDQAKVRPAERS